MSEPMLSIERVRQPLTAILGHLDLAQSPTMPVHVADDIVLARAAALRLKEMCDEAEKNHRNGGK